MRKIIKVLSGIAIVYAATAVAARMMQAKKQEPAEPKPETKAEWMSKVLKEIGVTTIPLSDNKLIVPIEREKEIEKIGMALAKKIRDRWGVMTGGFGCSGGVMKLEF